MRFKKESVNSAKIPGTRVSGKETGCVIPGPGPITRKRLLQAKLRHLLRPVRSLRVSIPTPVEERLYLIGGIAAFREGRPP